MARVENAILWQSHRSGLWICEIRDRLGFKSIGLGSTKLQTQMRAYKVAGWDTKSLLPMIGAAGREVATL